ncbi:MAG: hypothetical protein U1E25_11850 [Methylocystis sp.]
MNHATYLLALATFLLTLSPLAANAIELPSRSDDVFLSRPGVRPSANQLNGTGAESFGNGQMRVGVFRCGELVGDDAQNCAAETKNESNRTSSGADLYVWAKNPLARMIVLSLLFAFLGLIIDIAAMPPFQGLMPEEVLSNYKTTWRAIMIVAILGGALLFPVTADIIRNSMTRLDHREGPQGAM